jgi:hypothetical protein
MDTVPLEPAASGQRRRLYREETVWEVREVDARRVPGSRGTTCLIFEAPDRIRRVWMFPAHWRVLDDASLWRLADRRPLANANVDRLCQRLVEAITRAAENLARAKALMTNAQMTMDENQSRRGEALALIQQYRAERQRIRIAVQSHALELREAGIASDDALLVVANAIRQSVWPTPTESELRDAVELQQLADRWCTRVYSAA